MKIKKNILLMISILSMLIICFKITGNNANAAHKNVWHKGSPKVLIRKGSWSTNYIKHNYNDTFKEPIYTESITAFGKDYGGNPLSMAYDINKKQIGGGIPDSAVASDNPHYKYIGRNYYLLKSSAVPTKHHSAMYYEFGDNFGSRGFPGITELIKVHDKNHIYMWSFYSNKPKNNKLNSKKSYEGYFIYNNKQK
ncbi:hypothetical protein DY120_01015 [Apilactobacillus micheneri]|uniref:Uncharacterized protein n=1 Tax=Apilactobacillus micheneri TaxID=1899430 RepID=A0ABY2Z3N7_9LACO|nr:hypothetical protein [Apilactobacillus micheneri]TPR26307.1 hypothetical protein DY114_01015 [Apilactobacillus micheneri]TPR27061.1 hypothetical protein DY111_01015 [Apilactobacillus micheneri]TPR27919.1 hypothetical protein DY113_04790 [Apilactobacillus micheneri]TPR31824.1 hypothetical protein DY117_01015 [Apilactobacillus micheneri]TPR32228.1 hypothetical protein DY120_01015 [Apilactobacillus micheneri]